jgi:hypothetical protein
MSSAATGVQRTSHRGMPVALLIGALAALIAVGAVASDPQPAQAASQKVVIVVGATGSTTSTYRSIGRSLARQASDYGARVIKIFSPYATWSKVKSAAYGANLLIYLGHGNGWPSPYAPFQTRTKDGMGLNASASGSDYNTEYFGERYLNTNLHLARNAVVLLIHLCYASGNPEWGGPIPPLWKAKARVDNYGSGFLRTGARAVFAEGLDSAHYVLHGLFKTNWTMKHIFWSAPSATGTYARHFHAKRSPWWAHAVLDPYKPGQYYRSIIGKLKMTASTWR